MVVLVTIEIETADQSPNGTIVGVEGDQSGFYLRQLHDLPVALGVLLDANERPALEPDLRRCLGTDHAAGKFESVARNGHGLSALAIRFYRLRLHVQSNCRIN